MRTNPRGVGFLPTITLIVTLASPQDGKANDDPAFACDQAAIDVATDTNIPLDILRALTRLETGRGQREQMQPWPWTVNMEGNGVWFDSEAQAQLYVFRHFVSGARSFDIGCFQINYRWHGHAFSSIEDMFDPQKNAGYAGRYLQELFAEHGDWQKAIGAYHSRTHRYAQRYLAKYAEIRARLQPLLTATLSNERETQLPKPPVSLSGSLVPQSNGSRDAIFHPGLGG